MGLTKSDLKGLALLAGLFFLIYYLQTNPERVIEAFNPIDQLMELAALALAGLLGFHLGRRSGRRRG